jgi:hypothetical protein
MAISSFTLTSIPKNDVAKDRGIKMNESSVSLLADSAWDIAVLLSMIDIVDINAWKLASSRRFNRLWPSSSAERRFLGCVISSGILSSLEIHNLVC